MSAFSLERKPTDKEQKLAARLSGKMRIYHSLPPHVERATSIAAVRKAEEVFHLWIARFVKLPKDTVGSFIVTFHTEAATDLFGLKPVNCQCQTPRTIYHTPGRSAHPPAMNVSQVTIHGGKRESVWGQSGKRKSSDKSHPRALNQCSFRMGRLSRGQP